MTHFQHLSRHERNLIGLLRTKGASLRVIAHRLDRHPSTISREVRRNSPPAHTNGYRPATAQARAVQRARLSHRRPRLKSAFIRQYVHQGLGDGWTPEQIAGRLPLDHPGLSVSHEAIYQYLYAEALELIQLLPQAHYGRHKRRRPGGRTGPIPHRVSIRERPSSVAFRHEIGHWECDTAVSSRSPAALGVLHERTSRLLKLKRLPRKTARLMADFIISTLAQEPEDCRHTLTYDNGAENCSHERVNTALKTQSYFCEPYKSWQKGGVENSVGLIRRYFPKKTDFEKITDQQVKRVEGLLNKRPRKCLGYRTPTEVYNTWDVAFAH